MNIFNKLIKSPEKADLTRGPFYGKFGFNKYITSASLPLFLKDVSLSSLVAATGILM